MTQITNNSWIHEGYYYAFDGKQIMKKLKLNLKLNLKLKNQVISWNKSSVLCQEKE